MLRRFPPLTYFACFFIVATLVSGVGHVLVALWLGEYFPGLVTAFGSVGLSVWLVRIAMR